MLKAKHLFLQFFVILFLATSHTSYAQIEVYNTSLDTIKSLVEEMPEVIEYFNESMLNPDSALIQDDYFFLYYGSAFVDSYNPYGEGMSNRDVNDLFDDKKYDEIIKQSTKSIEDNPGYMKPYYNMGIAYDYMGDSTMAKLCFNRYYQLLRIPFFSGTGESEETAFVVRTVDDEYNILYELELSMVSQALVYGENGIPYDVLTVIEKGAEEGETKKLYFNIYLPFKVGMSKMFNMDLVEDDKKSEKKKKTKKKKKKTKKKKKKKKKRKKDKS